jgi:7,8-dihydro-6-hydroxymethylpterin-pyrophosphokinase
MMAAGASEKGPRNIDIDILLFEIPWLWLGSAIPHPAMHERRFGSNHCRNCP